MVNPGQIKCILVDDEPIARIGLRNYIARQLDLVLVGEYRNTHELEQFRGDNPIDLMFLDIEMPYQKGTDYLQEAINPPMVIITSAHWEYALQGYELNIVDYLLKPFSFKRFQDAVAKAHALQQLRAAQTQEHIFIKENRALIKLSIKEIRYVQALENYVIFHTGARKHIVKSTLQNAEKKLHHHGFIQVHKSFVVNVHHILKISGNELEIVGISIPVSRYYRKQLMECIPAKP